MENAANNIDATSKSLKQMLFETHYKVGYFQREYKWERNNIEDLLTDLERSFNSNWDKNHIQKDVALYDKYYMGPIVLFVDNAEFSIVDGQQRLTTFILIMIYLNHQYERIMKVQNKFKGYIYSDYYGTESYNINIEERIKMLDFLFIKKDFDDAILSNESCKNILERYNDIKELFPISLLTHDILPLFTSWITERLVFIEILTQTSESAYTIFETMNDRGLNLTQTELLKSFLLSNVKDESKIKELDYLWKQKISQLNAIDNDQDFFKSWLRAKYAVSIRNSEKDSENKDFEKISTRFSSWIQENTKVKNSDSSKLLLDIKDPISFYFFVKSDFAFFSDLYILLKNLEQGNMLPEHRFHFLTLKGVSPSLSYPLILSPIKKTDDEGTINEKIEITTKYLDAYGCYRMLLGEPVTQSSIRNSIYLKVRDIRNEESNNILEKFNNEIKQYKLIFLNQAFTRFDSNSRYILARLYSANNTEIPFEDIYFQRRKDSMFLYSVLKNTDFETEKMNLPSGLKDIFIGNLCSYTLIPRMKVAELDALDISKRLIKMIKEKLIIGINNSDELDLTNLRQFFIERERKLKQLIVSLWRVE